MDDTDCGDSDFQFDSLPDGDENIFDDDIPSLRQVIKVILVLTSFAVTIYFVFRLFLNLAF